jgi:hypothetical protein
VDLIIVEVPRNLPISHMFNLVSTIPKQSAKVDNYVVSSFGFTNKCLARDGSTLFFYDDKFRVLKDMKLYLENYKFKIHSKFVIVNSMHCTNLEFSNKNNALPTPLRIQM